MRRVVIGLLFATLVLCGLGQPASASDEMSIERAGKYYLKVYCPYSHAVDRFNQKILHGRDYIYFPEVKRRLPELRNIDTQFAGANNKLAGKLFNPPGDWPSTVSGLVDDDASRFANMSDAFLKAGRSPSANGWFANHGKGIRLSNQTRTGAEIRARLELPPLGQGC